MKRIFIAALMAVLFYGQKGYAQGHSDFWIKKGKQEINASLSMSRMLGIGDQDNAGWAPGFVLSYGYFVRDWIKPEAQIQFDAGLLSDNRFFAGGALGGVSFYYNQGSRLLPFAGFRLGFGGFFEQDSDGGSDLKPCFIIAPKAGILLRLSNKVGFQTYLEYQSILVFAKSRYNYGDRHLIKLPIGVSLLF